MDAVIITEKFKHDWEAFVNENPHTLAWQSYEWSNVLKNHYDCEFYPIAMYDRGTICGILPLYRVRTGRTRETLMSVPYAVAGGIASDDEPVRRALLEKAIDLSEQFNSCDIVLKHYKRKVEGDLAVDDNYYNRELGLSSDVAAVWASLSDKVQQNINDTDNCSFTLDYPSSDIDVFYRILVRHHHLKGVPCVSKQWIKDLLDFNMYSIALLSINGKYVAGTMVKEFKKTVSFPFTCAPSLNDHLFIYRLYWELVKYFSLGGKEIFHSGRIPNNDTTDAYRLGWGGVRHGYYYQYYPNKSMKMEFSTKRGKKRELLEKCWKMMPEALTGFLGPHVVKRYP